MPVTLRKCRRLVLGSVVAVCAVILPRHALASDSLEEILRNADQDKAYAELLDLLDAALRQPIDLTTASRAEIAGLPWMSPYLADSIIAARARGALRSSDDLRKVAGLNDRYMELIRPFVVVSQPARAAVPLRSSLRLRLVASPPSGSLRKLKTYGTYSIEKGDFGLGLVVEKDKREKTFNDFQAYYVKKSWGGADLIVGDFVLASGHGLVFSDAFGESPGAVYPWRFGRGQFGLKPSTSTEENCMLEGAGLSYNWAHLGLCLVGSRSKFDARIDDQGRAVSLVTSGSHVSESEIEGKDALTETLAAAAARYTLDNAQVTVNLARADLDRDLATEGLNWRNDRARLLGSADFSLEAGGSMIFGEAALAEGGGPALIGGLASGGTGTRVLVLGRDYSRSYLSLHSRPFAFYSGTGTGERGVFMSIARHVSQRAALSLGNDIHQRDGDPDRDFGASGTETFADAAIETGDFTFSLGEKLARASEATFNRGTEETARLRSRIDVEYRPRRAVEFRLRYERLSARQSQAGATARSTSDLVRLDLGLTPWEVASVKAGFYTFKIDGYEARIYQYEAGLPYYPSLEMLKSDGSRCYVVLSLGRDRLGRAAVKAGRTVLSGGEDDLELAATYMVRF